jgi:hypothetical protein
LSLHGRERFFFSQTKFDATTERRRTASVTHATAASSCCSTARNRRAGRGNDPVGNKKGQKLRRKQGKRTILNKFVAQFFIFIFFFCFYSIGCAVFSFSFSSQKLTSASTVTANLCLLFSRYTWYLDARVASIFARKEKKLGQSPEAPSRRNTADAKRTAREPQGKEISYKKKKKKKKKRKKKRKKKKKKAKNRESNQSEKKKCAKNRNKKTSKTLFKLFSTLFFVCLRNSDPKNPQLPAMQRAGRPAANRPTQPRKRCPHARTYFARQRSKTQQRACVRV